MCKNGQSKGKQMLTRTATLFCKTNNKMSMQPVIMLPTMHSWIIASCVSSVCL